MKLFNEIFATSTVVGSIFVITNLEILNTLLNTVLLFASIIYIGVKLYKTVKSTVKREG